MDAGIDPEDAERILAERRPQGDAALFAVWRENLLALEIFLALGTQWRVAVGLSGGRRTGLIMSEATDEMKERGIPRRKRLELRGDLRAMERAALDAWAAEDADV